MLHDVTLAIYDPATRSMTTAVVQVDADGGDDAASKGRLAGQLIAGERTYTVSGVAPAVVVAAPAAPDPPAPKRRTKGH